MTPVEIIDSLEKDFAQLQVNLQAHIQIKQIFNAMRQNMANSNNGKQGGQGVSSIPKEEKKEK
jgi:hypothetical protein